MSKFSFTDRNGKEVLVQDKVKIDIPQSDPRYKELKIWHGFAVKVMSIELGSIGGKGIVLIQPLKPRPDGEGKAMFNMPAKYLIK